MLSDIILDHLTHPDVNEKCEIEIRMPCPHDLMDTVKSQVMHKDLVGTVSRSIVTYCDESDIRCVDGCWQRKRNVLFFQLPCFVSTNLAVSVESAAKEPDGFAWKTFYRERTTYKQALRGWKIEFSKSTRNCNIEIEFIGKIHQLPQACVHLTPWLDTLHAALKFTKLGRFKDCRGATPEYPFVRLSPSRCLIDDAERKHLLSIMSQNQPVSFRRESPGLPAPMVSLKFDGVRMILTTKKFKNEWFVCGLSRNGMPWFVPSQHVKYAATFDCELLSDEKSIIIFDLISLRNQMQRGTYQERLRLLSSITLPKLACNWKMKRKVFFPLSTVTDTWYAKQSNDYKIDGLIVHSGLSHLNQHNFMYKWKPEHTVDLYVGDNNKLLDGNFTKFRDQVVCKKCKLKKGQVWECRFVDGGKRVQPIRQRRDKKNANARHVCSEIATAFEQQITLPDLVEHLQTAQLQRTSKRKRV